MVQIKLLRYENRKCGLEPSVRLPSQAARAPERE